jgi:hypothetical protein
VSFSLSPSASPTESAPHQPPLTISDPPLPCDLEAADATRPANAQGEQHLRAEAVIAQWHRSTSNPQPSDDDVYAPCNGARHKAWNGDSDHPGDRLQRLRSGSRGRDSGGSSGSTREQRAMEMWDMLISTCIKKLVQNNGNGR